MSASNEGRALRVLAWVLGIMAALALLIHLSLHPRRQEVSVVFPSLVSLVRATPDYVSLERSYDVEERETIDAPLWSDIEILRRYEVRVRAEIACDAFDESFISYAETDSSCTVTLTLPHAALQPPVILYDSSYRPEPDTDGPGGILIPAEERAEIMAAYDALMEQNARTEALHLAMEDALIAEAEGRAAADLTEAALAVLGSRGFDEVEVVVVFEEYPTAPGTGDGNPGGRPTAPSTGPDRGTSRSTSPR
ncbi:MAG TPA: DUF4230 domain-containing protein [Candidatus Fermentibacter sp.]|nr:DUF4230 domain-containing protein [Candidatus Fermentibacter sp.]